MPLRAHYERYSPVCDYSVLEDMPLEDAPLIELNVAGSQVSDLTPVKSAPIEALGLTGSKVADYTQLEGMKLRRLWIDADIPDAAAKIIRDMDTLTQINDMAIEEFWREYDKAKHER